ncbi:MAG: hypothetical protein A2X25_09850 [Chloroflexi bacterium GWB2_49_20]|nr:MAG: hypothetical protein A2X25_09850 [Chloroflexi bacterium GWB2_49_20]OGN79275.1 MAG: hypothetical protein A2X26_04175 [Chloroflexi bacterium GWC2_49_37]OGN82955.1 MAG: hypothetical protein A2X27_08520 [Chloroflexi bacterium GWD2_49_16]HCC78610.1 hypothetical protein [Anaerolineae bacterium]
MEELLEYRQRMLNKLAEAPGLVETAVFNIKDQTQPLEAGGWNIHQVVAHMRDVNQHVYLLRLHRIIDEENPMFENFDGEAWMAEHYQPLEPIRNLVSEFREQCRSTADWLRSLPLEAWNLPGKHPSFGKHSLQWWVERTLAHISEHLAQLEQKEVSSQ